MTDQTVTIYHNPACSKSRETLDILQERPVTPEIVEYLQQPPTKELLNDLISKLKVSPKDIIRTTETVYIQSGFNIDTMSDEEIIDAICQYPALLQRPIVVVGNKAIIGRPPVKVLDII